MQLIADGLAAGRARRPDAGGTPRSERSKRAVAREAAAARARPPRAHDRSAREGALRHGARPRAWRVTASLFMEALEAEARRADQAAADEHRRRARRRPARHGIHAAGGHASSSSSARVAGLTAEVAEEYARERPMRIKFPVEYDGAAAASPSRTVMARTITAEETDVVHALVGRARAAMARDRATTTRPTVDRICRASAGPAATRRPRPGSPT